MLDLWTIGALQMIGGLGAVFTVVSIRRGHYAALLIGLMAGLCVVTATIWFLAIAPSTFLTRRRPAIQALGHARRLSLRRWLIWDALLIGGLPALLKIFVR